MILPHIWNLETLLPVFCMGLMGLALLIYMVLDGYVLGIGILSRRSPPEERDILISTVAPYWDANQTWLVLGVGLLIICFPGAQGVILGKLYEPVLIMLVGLILRGVSFEFRAKLKHQRVFWDKVFYVGSIVTSFSQGVMLGQYVTGLTPSWESNLFSLLTGFLLLSAHVLLGASWLIIKASETLRHRAIQWAQGSLIITGIGIILLSIVTPAVSPTIFNQWFSFPNIILLAPIPLMTIAVFSFIALQLHRLKRNDVHTLAIWPLIGSILILLLAFTGLAYSIFPYLVMDKITIWQAAAAPQSLEVILVGALIVLPLILGYTIYVHQIFRGKTGQMY